MNLDRRLIKNIDGPLVGVTAGLMLFGLVAVYSATYQLFPADPHFYVKRQIIGFAMGLAASVPVLLWDYTRWSRHARLIYVATLALLASVLFLAPDIAGAGRWLVVGPLQIQPAEIAKLALIVTLAKHLSEREGEGAKLQIFGSLFHLAVPVGLVIVQPDLGTALVFAGILFGMLFVAGVKIKHLAAMAGTGLLAFGAAVLVSMQGWLPIFKEYQIRRLFVFVDPYSDPTGAGWNVIQSMIAIGSGGFFGKGLFAGSQTQLSFVPARHTDFIFSVIGEEMGFLGAGLLLAGYGLFLLRGLRLIGKAKDTFGQLLITGVLCMLFFHVVINVGMAVGIMPVTGLPLPFASVGGTSLMANMIGVSMILNVHMRRHKILF